MNPRTLINETAVLYSGRGIPDARTDASLLLSWLTGRDPLDLRLDDRTDLSEEILTRFAELREKRLQRIPLQHLTHEQYFGNHLYYVDDSVLIPRPETQELVLEVLERLKNVSAPQILDLCCGSGCIGIEIALARPDARVLGADLSEKALAVSRLNAGKLQASVAFLQSDLFAGVPDESFDAIVSNPPYIPTEDCKHLQEEVLFEPHMALDGGTDGLDFYRRIIQEAPRRLKKNGLLAFETQFDQPEIVAGLLREAGFENITTKEDMSHMPRMVFAVYTKEDAHVSEA